MHVTYFVTLSAIMWVSGIVAAIYLAVVLQSRR
jgi:hypothetical protein